MRIGLDSPQRRAFFLIGAVVIALPYVFWVQAEYRASMWAQSIDLKGLQRAVEIDADLRSHRLRRLSEAAAERVGETAGQTGRRTRITCSGRTGWSS